MSHYQILQANMIRAYNNGSIYQRGRRPIAQPMSVAANPANAGGPSGSVRIAADGSTAAFVPASRALTWQSTDAAGVPVVRERLWVTMQPGEIRTCTGCHGENARNQAGATTAPGYRITVQTDQGYTRTYEVGSTGDLHVGDRVRVDGGVIYRG